MMKKTAVSVRRNMAKNLTNDDSKTTQPVQDMGLDQMSKGKHVEEEDKEESQDNDDVFSDALDTLSLKHVMSGVNEATKPPRPTDDPQPREFMLNRFLPAAKSMTTEQQPPHYPLKRQPFHADVVPRVYQATPKRYEESDEEYEDNLYKRGCGMMMSPQLSFRNSVHGQVKPSKVAQIKSRFQSMKKLALGSIYKQKWGSRAQSPVHPCFEKFNLTSTSMPSSPYRQAYPMSPYPTVGNSSPLHHNSSFPGTRKEAEIMRANRLNNHIRNNNTKSQESVYPKSTRLDSDLSPLCPLPPKKPSDSWLFCNIPSASSKIIPQPKENSTSVTKWETIVKTSCIHRDRIRYSEELVAKDSKV